MCTYCDVDDGHPRTRCPTRQEREIGTERQLDDPLEVCPDCGTVNNRSVNDSCWRCGYEFVEQELVTDGGTVEDWHGTEAPASVDGVDLLEADACPACESTGTFFEGPAGYFTCGRCHSTWAGDAGDAEIVTYLEWSENKELVTDGGQSSSDTVRIYCVEDSCEFEETGEYPSLPTWCPDCGVIHPIGFVRAQDTDTDRSEGHQ